VTLAVKGSTISGRVFWRHRVPEFKGHRLPLTGSRWDITMADRSSNEADFLCILLYLAWRLWKSVVTLAVTGNTISGRVFRHQRVPEFQRHRLPLTGSRWDIRWLIGRRTKPTFCVFLYLTWRLWKSVVTLVVTGILFPVGFFGVMGCRSLRGIDCR
jgi:hypothetical protein